MPGFRRWSALCALGLCAVSLDAAAQQGGGAAQGGPAVKGKMILNLERGRSGAAEAARARAAQGDCKGALDLFDQALTRSIDPTLYRDRGQCHDKLGDTFPAIDDYRAYLTEAPEAKDAPKIQARLDELIKKASQDMAPVAANGGDYEAEMRGGVLVIPGEAHRTTASKPPDKDDEAISKEPASSTRPLSAIERDEARATEAKNSPIRKGTGFILGAYAYPRYVFNPWAFRFGQGVGATLRYSISSSSTLLAEIGYLDQLGSSGGGADSATGVTTLLGYEYRLPLDSYGNNQLFFAAGGGYEQVTQQATQQTYASFAARGRAGWRHVFGASLGLDVAADGGLLLTDAVDAPATATGFGVGAFVGGVVSLEVGF